MNWRRLMWANDFPHSDSTWPWSQEMLAEQTTHLTRRAAPRDPVRQRRGALSHRSVVAESGGMSRTGADLVASALKALGVRHAFAIVSIHNMPILDAINRLGFTKLIDVRHEQAGTHAADGYARATGEIGVMIASTGPGTTNTVTGLYEAAYASSRVLVITGQAETGFYGRGLGYVHEADKQMAMLRSVVAAAESPREHATLRRCWRTSLRRCRTGAVSRARSRYRSICNMRTWASNRSPFRAASRTHPEPRRR